MATIGQQLISPESGWKRIEETDVNFTLTSTWTPYTDASLYSGGAIKVGTTNSEIRFNFTGSNLRFIGRLYSTSYTTKADVYIDGKLHGSFSQTGTNAHRILNYEAINLSGEKHYVKIVNTNNAICFDAIDIDSNGSISTYNENPYIKRVALKNQTTSQHYSLADNTLIHLPSSSDKNMILHGIEQGKEIQLDVPFDKQRFFVNEEQASVLGAGRLFEHVLTIDNKIKKISIK